MKRLFRPVAAVCVLVLLGLTFGLNFNGSKASATVPGTNSLVSTDSSGDYANGRSGDVQISGDGQYVAFDSIATNLVSGDTNGYQDVFIKDTSTDDTTLASITPSGTQDTTNTYVKGISYDGRYVLLSENSTALLVRDTVNDTSAYVPIAHGDGAYGVNGGAISADGRYVVWGYLGGPAGKYQAAVTDMQTDTTTTLSLGSGGVAGNADSQGGGISCDGGVMTFSTQATNVGSGPGTYIATIDPSGTVTLTRISTNGSASSVSCNGNIILYSVPSGDGTVYSIYEYNRLTGQTTTIATEATDPGSVSDDGRYVAFAAVNHSSTPSYPTTDAGTYSDVYLYDTKTGTYQLVTFTAAGNISGEVENSSVSLSADGSKVAYNYTTPSTTGTIHELISGLTTGTANNQYDIYESSTGF